MITLFLSHSSSDHAAAARLRDELARQGYDSLFLDFDPEHGIPAGRSWEQELYRQLRRASGVIVLCSERSIASRWVFAEAVYARMAGKHLFPVRIDHCTIDTILQDRQIVDLTQPTADAYQRLFRGLLEAGLDPADSTIVDKARSPYPGLDAFEEADTAVFFGRSAETLQALDALARIRRLQTSRFMIVVGASGSGKSSLVKAGIVPKLRQHADHWAVVDSFRPGAHALQSLAVALINSIVRRGGRVDVTELRAQLETAVGDAEHGRAEPLETLFKALGTRLRRAESPVSEATVLLVIDQLEELLIDAPGSAQLTTLLRVAAESATAGVIMLATLRSDFLPVFDRQAGLRAITYEHMILQPLTRDNITEAIEAPAQLAEVVLGLGLVQTLLDDLGGGDALPLLAFTLRRLWERFAATRRLTVEHYRALGGVAESIDTTANSLLGTRPTIEDEAALRDAFLQMVRVDEDGKHVRVPVSWDVIPPRAWPRLELFVQERLLVSRGEGDPPMRMVEVAHEVVFSAWKRLAWWLEQNREFLLWRRRLGADLVEHRRSRDDPDRLLRGNPLLEAERWLQQRAATLTEEERTFVRASVDARQRHRAAQRSRTAVTLGIAGLLIVIVAASVYAWYEARQRFRSQVAQYIEGLASPERDSRVRSGIGLARTDPKFNVAAIRRALEHPPKDRLLFFQGVAEALTWPPGEWQHPQPVLAELARRVFQEESHLVKHKAIQAFVALGMHDELEQIHREQRTSLARVAGVSGGMVQILGGSFVVGADRAEADEAPAHLAPAIPAFWIDLREVVNREWNSVLPQRPPRMEIVHRGDLGAGFARRRLDPQYADQPVAGVSQDDAIAYCRELGKQLPTRAEWEAASRGPWGWTFPWGENRERAKELKIVRGQQAFWEVRVPPAAIDVSVFGVRDMAGRVYEWTADGTQGASAFTFTEGPDAFRLTRRLVEPPAKFGADLGFRCVCRYTPTTNGHCAKT